MLHRSAILSGISTFSKHLTLPTRVEFEALGRVVYINQTWSWPVHRSISNCAFILAFCSGHGMSSALVAHDARDGHLRLLGPGKSIASSD